jgi:hypothetical protein
VKAKKGSARTLQQTMKANFAQLQEDPAVMPRCCCESDVKTTAGEGNEVTVVRTRRWRAIAGWILPAGGLMLLPKCPACLAAYIAIVSGVGISVSAASYLRTFFLTVCIASITCFATRRGWRLFALVSAHRSGGAIRGVRLVWPSDRP